MSTTRYSEGPLTHWGKIPVYITTLVMAARILGLVLGLVVALSGIGALQFLMVFTPSLTWPTLQIWRPLTYILVETPNFFSIFGLLFLWMYGREVENYLGRVRTIIFYLIITFAPVVMATLFWLLGAGESMLDGGYYFGIGVIIAFATLYPNMEWFFGIPFKYMAAACAALGAAGANSGMGGFLVYLASCGTAWGYIRWLQYGAELPNFGNLGRLFKRHPKLKVVRGTGPDRPAASVSESKLDAAFKPGGSVPQETVDAILEKVGSQGINSLSAKEKQLLQKHSADLAKRARTAKDRRNDVK